MTLSDYGFPDYDENLYCTKELYLVPLKNFQYVPIYKNYNSEISLLTIEDSKIKKVSVENLELQMHLINFGVEWQTVMNLIQRECVEANVSMLPTLMDSDFVLKQIRSFNYLFADKDIFFKVFRYYFLKSSKEDLCILIDGVAKQEKLEQNQLVYKK